VKFRAGLYDEEGQAESPSEDPRIVLGFEDRGWARTLDP
jgi:hypothetical protein